MKRITYISTVNEKLDDAEIKSIGRIASQKNRLVGVTGILVSAHDYFFQIIEGEEHAIDSLIERIRLDCRHRDLLILRAEHDVAERMFPAWSMRTVQLMDAGDLILQAIRMMLENIAQSHRVIERYTQPSVLKFLTEGINPLNVPARKTEKLVLFTDMVAFSYLSDRFPVEEVVEVVNAYLEICSTEIVAHGGVVTKYVGDCVIAHFSLEGADDALKACLEILKKLRLLREGAGSCRLMRFLYGGFGLAAGTVIEGNVGSSVKMDFTILGATVNMAARLESLTREVGRPIAMSESVKEHATHPWLFRPLGDFKLKGCESAVPVFSLDDTATEDFKSHEVLVSDVKHYCGAFK